MNDEELMEMEIENLEEDRKHLLNHVNQLQSNWNSLREYIKEIPEEEFVNTEWYVNILDKMNELEGGNKDENRS